jgi:ubiquinol-cytochrome c reductase cytochrome c subunit
LEIDMIVRAFIIGALAGVLSGPAFVAQAWAQAAAGSAANGEKLYTQQGCYECHGTVGQGSSFSGPRLASPVLPTAGFVKQLRQPRFEMPPYSDKVLSDAQAGDIIAYLQSIPRPAAADSIALLK